MAKKSFAWSPLRRLMKEHGADIVAGNAVDSLIENLESVAKLAAESALKLRQYGVGKEKLSKKDLDIALKYF